MESPFVEIPVREVDRTEEVDLSGHLEMHSPFRGYEAESPTTPPSRWLSLISDTVTCRAEPLLHGEETYKHMVAALRTATKSSHYIYILGWMLDVDFEMVSGDPHSTLYSLLSEAARRGVEIRIQIWDNPIYHDQIDQAQSRVFTLPGAILMKDNYTFGSAGVKKALDTVRGVVHATPGVLGLSGDILEHLGPWKTLRNYVDVLHNEGSHHEKVVVVKGDDGLIGFCGGVDINPNRIKGVDSRYRSTVLHDVHCELRGYAAWALLHRFLWRWQVLKEVYPWMPEAVNGRNETRPGPDPGSAVAHVKIVQTYNHPNKPIKDRSIREAVRIAIANAKHTIHVEDQYMISLEIATWLNAKLKEPGFTSVTCVTQDDEYAKSDLLFPKGMRKKFLDYLCNGLSPDVVKSKVFFQMLHPDTPLIAHHRIHSKIYIIDDDLAIVGSANCSSRSMTHDSETAAVIFNDPGSSTNFVKALRMKLTSDPFLHVIPYEPNPKVDDLDDELRNGLRTIAKTASSIFDTTILGPVGGIILDKLPSPADIATDKIEGLIADVKPALIDIIDPDADNTVPQQEVAVTGEEEAQKDPLPPSVGSIDVASFLPPAKSTGITKLNREQVRKSGLTVDAILAALRSAIDVEAIRVALDSYNAKHPESQYTISNQGNSAVDALFTEAVHQFQRANYLNPNEHDGIIGVSTLDTLGFIHHGFRQHLPSQNFYGKIHHLDNVASSIPQLTSGEFTAANWFDSIFTPAWLGVRITDGIHPLLFRKLQEAELWLKTQDKYRALTPAALGRALGFNASTRFSAGRFSAGNQAMHGVGLAIDIDPTSNPWIGAGWVQSDERYRMIEALRKASGDSSLPGKTIFEYLDSIAGASGNDTRETYQTLKRRSDEFVAYLKTHQEESAYWKKSLTFYYGNPLNGFVNLHADLVYALRQIAGLAWGAVDFGPRASGDIMHFDMRTIGVGKLLARTMGGFIPVRGHPTVGKGETSHETENAPRLTESAYSLEPEYHEALGEALSEEEPEQPLEESTEETGTQERDWGRAVQLNRYYATKLGWDQHQEKINDLLLPFSGMQNVSLGEEAFARALAEWQLRQGFPEAQADGILGPATWRVMRTVLFGDKPEVQQKPAGSGVPSAIPRWVETLTPLLNKYRGDIPLRFLIGWISVESDGQVGTPVTSLGERGLFQLHPDNFKTLGVTDPERLSTDPEYSIIYGIKLVRHLAAYADQTANLLGIDKSSDLYWHIVKMYHWLPGGVRIIVDDMRKSGFTPTDWESFKSYVVNRQEAIKEAMRAKFNAVWDPLVGLKNAEKVFERGKHLVPAE